jgi:hypothetical protein
LLARAVLAHIGTVLISDALSWDGSLAGIGCLSLNGSLLGDASITRSAR